MPIIAFIDTETDREGRKIQDIGGIRSDGPTFHGSSMKDFARFLQGSDYICGHNILNHDLKYIGQTLHDVGIHPDKAIDTLYLSPLMFPKKPYPGFAFFYTIQRKITLQQIMQYTYSGFGSSASGSASRVLHV